MFASQLFPNRAPAVFPTYLGATEKVTFSISMIHPIGTIALTSGANEGAGPRKIDANWQVSLELLGLDTKMNFPSFSR